MAGNAVKLMQEPTKDELIREEELRLLDLFKEANPNKLDFVREQVKQLAFFNVSIQELQDKINQWGTLIQYDNGGGQTGVKPNPDVKTLTDYQKLTNGIFSKLLAILPDRKESYDDLSEYRPFTIRMREKTPEEIEKEIQEDEERTKRINAEIAAAAEKLRREREQET